MPCSACSGWLVCCRSAALSTSDSATARSLDSKISAAACLQSTPTGQLQVAQSTSQTAIPPKLRAVMCRVTSDRQVYRILHCTLVLARALVKPSCGHARPRCRRRRRLLLGWQPVGSSLCLVATLLFGHATEPEGCICGFWCGESLGRGCEPVVQVAVVIVVEFHPVIELFCHMLWVEVVAVAVLHNAGEKFGYGPGTVGKEAETFASQVGIIMQLGGQCKI